MEEQTLDGILSWFKTSIEQKQGIRPIDWMEGAIKLNVMMETLDNEISEAEFLMTEMEVKLLEEDMSAACAKKMKIKAINYKEYLKAKAKKERCVEFIRLSKIKARIQNPIEY